MQQHPTETFVLMHYARYEGGTLLGAYATIEEGQAAADAYPLRPIVDDGDWLVLHRVTLGESADRRSPAGYIEDEGEPNPRDIIARGGL